MQTILIIDDDLSSCESLSMYLSEEGYDVVTANTGLDGIEMFTRNRIDLVILDIRLPDIDGFAVLSRLKELNPKVRVIMITAFHDKGSIARAMAGGAADYIRKPIDIDEMEEAVRSALG